MTHYIGLDAHSKTCVFVVLDAMGRQIAYREVRTCEKEVVGLVESVSGAKALVFGSIYADHTKTNQSIPLSTENRTRGSLSQ